MSDPTEESQPSKQLPDRPPSSGKAAIFRARTLSTISLWSLVALALWWGNPVVIATLLALFGTAACWEYLTMLRSHGIIGRFFAHGTLLVGAGHLLAVAIVSLRAGAPADFWIDSLTLCGATILGLSAVVLVFPLREKTLQELAATILGVLYIPLLFAYAIRLFFLAGQPGIEANGVAVLLLLIAVTKSNDMGAYLVGTAIGKNKMIPRVSPGKTWEGFIGAAVITILVAMAIVHFAQEHLHPLTLWDGLAIGVLLTVFSVLGDLAASAIKRCVGAKDSGHSLPGIGGILDLIDSLLFTAPVLFLYLVMVASR